MALTTANAQISIQDGANAAVNLTAFTSIGFFTPGNLVTFALQSTAGINRAEFTLICPKYPGLHGLVYIWTPGNVNGWQVTMPAATLVSNAGPVAGIRVGVTISDGAASIAAIYNDIESSAGGAGTAALQNSADYVVRAALPAYTNTAGVLTGNGNAAITSGMVDGQTPAVGDIFLLPNGIAAAGVDVGLYSITAVGSGSAPFSATRVGWAQGATVLPKSEVLVRRGTLFGLTTWVNTLAGLTNIVGVASFTVYPRYVGLLSFLAAGTSTFNTVPVLSTGTTFVGITRQSAAG